MYEPCLVCLLQPLVYFSFCTHGFLQSQCPHSKSTLCAKKLWRATLATNLLLIIAIPLVIYLNLTQEEFDFFSILTTSELLYMELDMLRLTKDRADWKKRSEESQLMLRLWDYTGNFGVERHHWLLSYKLTLSVILFVVAVNLASLTHFFCVEMNWLTALNVLVRFCAGLIICSAYTYSLYEYLYFRFLFKWSFEQIEREIRSRLVIDNKMFLIYNSDKISVENSFVRRLNKLRRLYTTVLYSFLRMKKMKRTFIVSVILIYHFFLSLMLFLAFIAVREQIEVDITQYLYVVKILTHSLHLGVIFVICEDVKSLWQRVLAVMFKIPLNVLSVQEAKEVEILTKFLVWEQPTENSRDMPVYKLSVLLSIIVDIITNTMVVIQLYFLFTRKA